MVLPMVFTTTANKISNVEAKEKEEGHTREMGSEDVNVASAPRRRGEDSEEDRVAVPFPIHSVALWSLPSIIVYPALLGSFIVARRCSKRIQDFFSSFSSS
jgi:hypothetical protein